MKYNIVSNEGERSSVTVFIGSDQFIATKEHPQFDSICEAVTTGARTDDEVRGMFDVTIPLSSKFARLSERVAVNHGRIFFDMMPQDDAVAKAILRFHSEGGDNFMALVNFMEKIAQNPNPHSREHLFRWLEKHDFGIAPDGDIIAYKGVGQDLFSSHGGKGIVNGTLVNGRLANKPGTIIEMPRDEVTFDPRNGCSTGLHVGNWSYASTFASRTLRVKVNPRDVVSVPSDSHDQKMRVCRYTVVDEVRSPDKSILFPGAIERTAKLVVAAKPTHAPDTEDAPKPKRRQVAAARKGKGGSTQKKPDPKVTEFPEYYEQFTKKHWMACTVKEIRFLAKEWGVTFPPRVTKEGMVDLMVRKGRARRRTW